ncbi:uncharacterized protein LOC131251085 [Magnolia sinica]|uniref:uncharacterized protein LOC131251085 n=1 Tax=Magnolia sinica TaxID=86752 RepID=UPI002659C28E|nr:uncharacterized protein LOC131251085 [Magnolia sinica]
MGLNLFDGSESSSSSDAEEISKIEIDQEFARRYEHNKRREDLHRLKELQKRGFVDGSDLNSDESSESDGYDDLVDSDGKDLEFYDALVKVKKMDPILDSKDSKLFDSENEDERGIEEGKKKKDKKPMYLKDVVAKHLIEEGAEFEEKDSGSKVKSYSDEQEEIRRSFLKAADEAFNGGNDDDDDDGGDLLVEKKKAEEESGSDGEIDKRLDEYFGDDGNLSENEMFLKSFLKNKMWVDREAGQKPTDEEIMEVLEDAEELEKQEKFELECQFRHEEGTGDRVLGHARFLEGSVRKKSNTRKEQRKRKEERQTLAELERKEELKHLKNVKKKEIMEKLEKIRAIAGIGEDGGCVLDVGDLEEDFNPEEYDKKMKEMFSEGYYDAEDPDPGFGSDCDLDDLKKPDFDKEDELLGLPKGWDVCRPGDGFLAVREKILKHKGDENDDEMSDGLKQDEEEERQDGKKKRKRGGFVAVREKILKHREDGNDDEILADPEQEEEGEEEEHRDGKRKRKHEISFQEKVALDKDLEEYYKLDYEDTIGDLKTRFKYMSVPSNRYGLNAAELLMADDKDLNQYVSLKKLAPYRQTEWKVSKLKRYDQKVKKKLLLQGGKANDLKVGRKGKSKHDSRAASSVPESSKQERTHLEESDGEAGDLSRRSKRRRRQAQLKLSQSRLKAYGKISPKPRSQKKH